MSDGLWTQWPDLDLPASISLVAGEEEQLTDEQRARITFYVPRYMSGRKSLEFSRQLPNLAVMQLTSAGFDDALDYVRPGMTLCNARGVHDESTAELAVGLALGGRRDFAGFTADQRAGQWRPETRSALTDSSVAIVGYGAIGQTIARMLSGFSVAVTAFSRRGTNGAKKVSDLPEVIDQFDVIILVMPLTSESAGLMDKAMLARMKDGALLVNVARGKVVDTDALVAELATGRISAALDVTDPEPLPPRHPLYDAPNLLLTPHVGGNTTAFEPRMRALIASQAARYVAGEVLENVVATG